VPVRIDVVFPVWDSVSRVVIWPYVKDHCGKVERLFVYSPSANAWTDVPLVPPEGLPIRGNVAIFDPAQNAMLLAGSVFCEDIGKQTHMFLYRHGPGAR